MEEGLFTKHLLALKQRSDSKEKIIAAVFEKTGVQIEKEELTVSKKQVKLSLSSVKRSILFQKGIQEILQSLGYSL